MELDHKQVAFDCRYIFNDEVDVRVLLLQLLVPAVVTLSMLYSCIDFCALAKYRSGGVKWING